MAEASRGKVSVQVGGGKGDCGVVFVNVLKAGEVFVVDIGEGLKGGVLIWVDVLVVETDFEGAGEGDWVGGGDGNDWASFAPEDDPCFAVGGKDGLGAIDICWIRWGVGLRGGVGVGLGEVVESGEQVVVDALVGVEPGFDVRAHEDVGRGEAIFVDVEEGGVDGDDFRVVAEMEFVEGSVICEFSWEVADEFDAIVGMIFGDGSEEFHLGDIVGGNGSELERGGAVGDWNISGGVGW